MLPLSGFLPGGRSSLAPPQSDDPEYTPFHLKSQRYCRMAPMRSLHVKPKFRSKFGHSKASDRKVAPSWIKPCEQCKRLL
jgi:hypothetical protein